VHFYVNNDIPSVITEAVLSCLYSNKRTVSGVADGVKLNAACTELSIKVNQLTENQWDLELPLSTDNLQCFLTSGEFSDVKFVVEGEKLCGHRAILCCHSEVLSAMLSGGFAESHQKEVQDIHNSSLIHNIHIYYLICFTHYKLYNLLMVTSDIDPYTKSNILQNTVSCFSGQPTTNLTITEDHSLRLRYS